MGWADIGRQGGIQRRMSVWYNRRSVIWARKVIIRSGRRWTLAKQRQFYNRVSVGVRIQYKLRVESLIQWRF